MGKQVCSEDSVVVKKVRFHNGKLVAEPSFEAHSVYLFPIPDSLQEQAKSQIGEGQDVCGRLGKMYFTGRHDKNGMPIFLRYFFPESLVA